MIVDVLLPLVLLKALIIGSVTDLKTREIPDQLNYWLIAMGLGFRLIVAIIETNPQIIISGVVGFTVFFVLSMLLFYTGQWGGGDAKLLMGMGAIMGLEANLNTFMLSFIINLILVGAIFGLIFSIFLARAHKSEFTKEWKKHIAKKYEPFVWGISVVVLILGLFFFEALILFASLALLILGSFYLLIFMKVVEATCMIKSISVDKLTEGDWIVDDVIIKGKRICGPSDLGITDDQIAELKKLKVKSIIVKEGIPFVPAFLLAFIVTYIFGSWFIQLILTVI